MELLIAGVYAVSKKIKTEKAIKKETKRQAYEDRYNELMEEHNQFHQQQQRRRTETEIGVRDGNDDEDERVERSQFLNTANGREDQVETDLARSQTWTGQGHVSGISTRIIQDHTRGSSSENDFDLNSELGTKKASIKTRQEYSSDDRSHDDDDNDDVDGPTRWVNDVVLERTRSLPHPLRIP